MTIQPINNFNIAVYLTPDELSSRSLSAEGITLEDALSLSREALSLIAFSQHDTLEIETYPDPRGLLMFIHIISPDATIWFFEDFDNLLCAVSTLHSTALDGSLYYWNSCFWLVTNKPCDILSEFGQQEATDPYIQSKLNEYGNLLLSGQILSILRNHF